MASSSKTSTQQKFYFGQLAFCVLEIIASLYLLVQHTRLKVGIQDSTSFCSFGKFADCDVVNASSLSEIFGIPLAAYGAFFYFILLSLGLLAQPKEKHYNGTQRILLRIALLGLALDIGIFFNFQVFILRSICLVCLTTYALGFLHLYCVVRSQGTPTPFLTSIKQAFAKMERFKITDIAKPKWITAGISLILFVAVLGMIPTFIAKDASVYQHADETIKKFFTEWKERPVRKIEVRSHNGSFGNPNANVQIIEFSDFECPYCRKAAFTLHTALQPLKDRVHFVYKHFPLNAKCNPALQYEMHAHACRLAMLAICAQSKGKFWNLHDQVFLRMNEEIFSKGFDPVLEGLAAYFTPEEAKQCMDSPTVSAQLSEDVRLGSTLNIQGTPAIFINGKLVEIPITVQNIQKLIEIEEKNSRKQ